MSVQIILLTSFGGAFATYLLAKISSRLRDVCAVIVSGLLVVFVALLYNKTPAATLIPSFVGAPLTVRLNMLSWFFAIAIVVVGFLSIVFSFSYIKGKERADFYYLMMLLVNAGMIGIVLSADLLTFYIFWEIMSWGAFLLISYNRGPALRAGMKYIVMSVIGSVVMLAGILSLYAVYETFVFSELAGRIASASPAYSLACASMLCIAFAIKNAVVPLHTWLPDAHSEAPAPFSAVLSGILIKMGTYGLILVLYLFVGVKLFISPTYVWRGFRFVLLVLASITILVPSFIAVMQNDAKKVLAWSSIAQAGYIILGITFGTTLGFAAGMFHFLNHATFKALLFFGIGAVEYRTKTRDLNSLGGLLKRMPITFIAVLVGTCGLIGIPLTNGFVSKWLLYKTLILEGSPFLAFIALIGTWGTILYGYKLLHHVFLGQLPEKYKNVRKAPASMQFVLIILSLAVVVLGILPGIPLKLINTIAVSMGMDSMNINIFGIASETGALNTVNILSVLAAAGIVVWIILKASKKSTRISQEDNYAAGAAIPAERYSYTVDFYNPLYRMIRRYLRDIFDEFYYWIAGRVQAFSDMVRRLYVGDVGCYAMYILLFLSALILSQVWWRVW
ncbi:MAG: hypothetical protein JW913_14485 [Chitinispirillaceae bacterium]|nr:hypothetical protein [Chitinispirillaceae bacterium]